MTPVTLWFSKEESQANFSFNHLSDGHTANSTPVPITKYQASAWSNKQWSFTLTYLDENNKVIA